MARLRFWVFIVWVLTGGAAFAQAEASQPSLAKDPGWPREFDLEKNRVIVYQPQISSWIKDATLVFVAAVEVAPKQAGKSVYGVLEAEAKTVTHLAERTVTLSDLRFTDLRFPNLSESEEKKTADLVRKALPSTQGKTMDISLDRILAYLEEAPNQQGAVEVNLKPPRILYSDKPSILVIFVGKPQFQKISNTKLMAAVNTNWDIFLDTSSSKHYLLNEVSWLVTDDLNGGTWQAVKELPKDFQNLPDDPNWQEVRKHVPGVPAAQVPVVFVSTEPAELIITDGEPVFEPVAKTKIMSVSNSESVLFYHSVDENYYLLVAGRWFKAGTLGGPWAAASTELPPDFAEIPADDENAFVRASVPGTQEAQDAVLLASIPQKTVIKKSEATCQVIYDGSPRFEEIKSTSVKYAINSPNDVFLVEGGYYCCDQGVWFAAPKPDGPWVVCTSVPSALYTIPPTHPKHNVTYVYVYESTPDTVEVGYTAGYSGEYVAATGVLMFGLGMVVGAALADDWDDDCWHWHYAYGCPSYYYSYGCGAVYHYGYGGYYRGARVYGPYGGAGRSGYYNPSTGAWARSGYMYGPYGGARAAAGYNPFTDTYAARVNTKTEYGSSGRFYAERGNSAVWGGHESGEHGTVGWAQSDEGGKIVAVKGENYQGVVAKDKEGNIYVGNDGNVYKREEGGSWSKNEGGDWESVERKAQGSTASTTSASQRAQAAPGETERKSSPAGTQAESRTGQTREAPATSETASRAAGTAERPQASTDRLSSSAGLSSARDSLASGGFHDNLERNASARERGNRNAAMSGKQMSGFRQGGGGGASRGGGGSRGRR